MDKNLLDILKKFSEKMHCPGCGKKFEPAEVQFMGQQNGELLLQLNCGKCKMPVWVNVLNGNVGKMVPEESILDFEEISTDEIISFHNELKSFDGDFRKVFSR